MNPEDIVEKTFGKLFVINYLGTRHIIKQNRKRYKHLYKCICSCGNSIETERLGLITGNKKSCGCIINISRRKGLYSVYTALYNQIRYSAIKRNHKFLLNREECVELVKKECHYCDHSGRALFKYHKRNIQLEVNYNGLDRIDSSKEYTLDNIVPCCYICNRAKMDLPYKDFISYIEEIKNNVCKQL